MAGDPNPDATGNYRYAGQYQGSYAYRREDGGWYIWHDPTGPNWQISVLLGDVGANAWENDGLRIDNPYSPLGGAAGTPTVTRA